MSNLFGFPSGLSGGSKETSYLTNYNTSHVTNYNTTWNTNRSTDYNTSNSTSHSTSSTTTWSTATSSFFGNTFQGPFTGAKRMKFVIHPNQVQVHFASMNTTTYQGGSATNVGYSGYMAPEYQTNPIASPHIAGYDTPYLNVLSSSYPSFAGSGSSSDLAAAKHMLQWSLDRVAESTHKFATTAKTGGTRGEWNSHPIRNPYGALGSNDAYLFHFDHGGVHTNVNGTQFYKVFAWGQFDWNSFYYDNATYQYEMESPRWGFYHWIEHTGTGSTQASTSKATNYTTTFPTSYTTTFQTTDGTSHTTTYNTNHTTSHITYG